MRTVVIAQARMGSSRLPGKVLKPLAGMPVVEHVLRRAKAAKLVDRVCLATTHNAVDDPLAEFVAGKGFRVWRGDERDVLGRYAMAARGENADIVVRITCDCPLVDPAVIDDVVRLRQEHDADYASNGLVMDWPDGLDCEVFKATQLFEAEAATTDPYDREHVTPWIRRVGAKSKVHLPGPGMPIADQRWTLDTPEDYALLTELFSLLPDPSAIVGWRDILGLIERNPQLSGINHHLRRQELPR